MELEPLTLFEIIIVIFFILYRSNLSPYIFISPIRRLLAQFADY